MPFRLLDYMVRVWELQFLDWLALPEEARAELAPFQPDFEHVLVDLSRRPLEEIGSELALRLVLTLMKAVREDRMEGWLEQFVPLLGELWRQPDRAGLLRVMLRYALEVEATRPSTVADFAAKIQD